jgi:hypothetical protein
MVDYDLERAGLPAPGQGKRILAEKKIVWTKNELTLSLRGESDENEIR